MVPLLLAAILSTEPLDCGDSLYLTNDTLVTMGQADTEEGEFYFGFDFTAETSYCSPEAPSTEVLLGGNSIKFKKIDTLPHDVLSSCTYVFGRDFFLAHKLDFDRNYHSISIGEEALEALTGSVNLKTVDDVVEVEMNGTCDISGSMPLGVLRYGGKFDRVPSEWKTDRNVSNFGLTSQNWPVWFSTGPASRFGLTLVPGRVVRFDFANNKLEWSAEKDDENELIIGEYVGVNEIFQIESVVLSYYAHEDSSDEDDEVPFREVISGSGLSAIDILSLVRSDRFAAIQRLRKVESLVYKSKSGAEKTAKLVFDPENLVTSDHERDRG